MADVSWLIRRLRAMSIPEVLWRLSQKSIQKQEDKRFNGFRIDVTSEVFNERLFSLTAYPERLHINLENKAFALNTAIHLLSGANYKEYKDKWNAGFQTENAWPNTFSYKLEYKQRDDIGDARTNWELNRHFQFALLAKDYAASGDTKYLVELESLFKDWNSKNPFLHGISWTSVMEVAIRCSNWCYAYGFLVHTKAPNDFLEQFRIGIINMTDYIANHYSRFSSANNHLIVEAFAIGQSGVLFDHKEWVNLALNLLTRELPLQNYSDGVNKELSLHYQSFYMEAMGLMMRQLVKNGIAVPAAWKPMLQKMCSYVTDCIGKYGEVVVFGDDDEGKILDLQGGEIDHYKYVLQLLGILLGEKYIDGEITETVSWLYTKDEIAEYEKKSRYSPEQFRVYKEGGNSILRSWDNEVLIGVDHAALGFGSIAAHGHADALSFQLFYRGNPVFVDPGTYIYHCDLDDRNEFRRTKNHNTVCIDGKDQSEVLGAFLWGRKANAELVSCEQENGSITLVMEHDGYSPVKHSRTLSFDGERRLQISDWVSPPTKAVANYLLAPDIRVEENADEVMLYRENVCIAIMNCGKHQITRHEYSDQYGIKRITNGVEIAFDKECVVEIVLK